MANKKSRNKAEEDEDSGENEEEIEDSDELDEDEEKEDNFEEINPKKHSKKKAFIILGVLVLALILVNGISWFILTHHELNIDWNKYNLNKYFTTEKRETLYQVSTYDALSKGEYDGTLSLASLKRNGDFGIGTFNALDGEMIMLDGNIYRAKSNGEVEYPSDLDKTPFAIVTYFDSDKSITINSSMNLNELETYILANLPTKNLPYAIKISGNFNYVETGSIPEQSRPYPVLSEALKSQKTFEINKTSGTIVGFYLPGYLSSLDSTGLHLHFINSKENFAGHLLEINTTKGDRIDIDQTPYTKFYFPKELVSFGNLTE